MKTLKFSQYSLPYSVLAGMLAALETWYSMGCLMKAPFFLIQLEAWLKRKVDDFYQDTWRWADIC